VAEESRAARIKELVDLVGFVAAPTSIVTGALYWAGFRRSLAYWTVFGIDEALLRFSTTDYVLRSVDVVFPVLAVTIAAALAGVAVHARFTRRLVVPGHGRMRRYVRRGLMLIGAVCLGAAAAKIFPVVRWLDPLELRLGSAHRGPVLGMFGTALTGYAAYLAGRPVATDDGQLRLPPLPSVAVSALTVLLALGLFWEAGEWADVRGQELAESAVQVSPRVVIYSNKELKIEGASVTPSDGGATETSFRYRYSGLQLLRFSHERYFLLIDDIVAPRVVVVPESPDLRFEFSPPEPPAPGGESTARAEAVR
jgi:hypothetical protein